MSLQFQQEVPDSDVLLNKVIKDLETGDEYPYRDIQGAITVIRRVAKNDGCSFSQALETLWVLGMSPEEFSTLQRGLKAPKA